MVYLQNYFNCSTLVNNRLLIKTVRFINRRQLSTAPVDGVALRCSTFLQCKARNVDEKKEKGCVTKKINVPFTFADTTDIYYSYTFQQKIFIEF
jgi:hypothetical protein